MNRHPLLIYSLICLSLLLPVVVYSLPGMNENMSAGSAGVARSQLYFEHTDHQLEVVRVKGIENGPTVLIFGGIHGDEPGGYFSSEILSKIKMIKGNLIIVPRVNFPSIMMNRREVHGDMNRKFVPGEKPGDPDADVIKLLKKLMGEADVFINQHDAYGFHREKYINELYNQTRYGQSLIIDSSHFYSKKWKKQFDLAATGKRIMARANKQIKNEKHHFGFWDHDSLSKNTKHPEMKKSATYFALTTYSIPAFGLETSKDLPTLTHKVKYQLVMIKAILTEFGLDFVFPSAKIDIPHLYWVEFLKNGKDVVRVDGNTNLRLKVGDRIVIKSINANSKRGLSANILGWGSINDINKSFEFKKNTTIKVKKNHITIGKIYLRPYHAKSVKAVRIELNGTLVTIPNWGKIDIPAGQYLKILGTDPAFINTRFDVRGFAIPGKRDDSGVEIRFKDLIPKYSHKKEGNIYYVKIYTSGRFAGEFQVELLK